MGVLSRSGPSDVSVCSSSTFWTLERSTRPATRENLHGMMLTCPRTPTPMPTNPNPLPIFSFHVKFCRFESPLEAFRSTSEGHGAQGFPSSARLKLSNLKGWWGQKREELALQQRESSRLFYIPSPVEDLETHEAVDERAARAKHCTEEGVKAGFKAASIACIASAVPTLTVVRTIPWFKANLNYTGQALIISAATIATYFIVTDHTIHECSRQGSYDALVKRRSGAP